MSSNIIYLDSNKEISMKIIRNEEGVDIELEYDDCNINIDTLVQNIESRLKIVQKRDGKMNIFVGDCLIAEYSDKEGLVRLSDINAFEARILSNTKAKDINVPFHRPKKQYFCPKTDLHTHFAGVLYPEVLVNIGLKHNITINTDILENIGIDTYKYKKNEKEEVALADVFENKRDINKFEEAMTISTGVQETFNKMESIYTLRNVFINNKALFADMLKEIAVFYKKTGVEYVELSHSKIIGDLEYLKIAHQVLPKIENETGVKLRFLAAIKRHACTEQNLDEVDRIKAIAQSPYVVGVDFNGYESNPTTSFKAELEEITRWTLENAPEFIIRVHAGENPIYKDNIGDTFKIIKEEHNKFQQGKNIKAPYPAVRIGHGLYGVNEEVLGLAKEMNAAVEFNMNSNLSLNNIDDLNDIPIMKYVVSGVNVVLGTDGAGIYRTDSIQEAELAYACGINDAQAMSMKMYEERLIEEDEIRFAHKEQKLKEKFGELDVFRDFAPVYFTQDGKIRYTKDIANKKIEEQKLIEKKLAEKIKEIGASMDPIEIDNATSGKYPILITGASENSWADISDKHQKEIKILMKTLTSVLDPNHAYLVTGGTNYGVEKEVHHAASSRNKSNLQKLAVLGTLTLEAAEHDYEGIEVNTITHAVVLNKEGKACSTWYDLPDAVLSFVKDYKGEMIAIGGGTVVRDMILRAHDIKGIGIHLMNGPKGASTDKAEMLQGYGYGFNNISELLINLYEKRSELFIPEFSKRKIGKYIEMARKELLETFEEDTLEKDSKIKESYKEFVNRCLNTFKHIFEKNSRKTNKPKGRGFDFI